MKRQGVGTVFLIGVAMLAAVAVVLAAVVPVSPCEECLVIERIHALKVELHAPAGAGKSPHQQAPAATGSGDRRCSACQMCRTCGGRGKITLLRAWLTPRHEAE